MLDDRRPDSGLLGSLRQSGEPARGRLKIFFGYAAGVGKTYAMLEAARHVMRYQGVQELLRSGINVFTTVNVQHLESLNDKVAAITGVSLAECIPDSVFDSAAPARPWGTSSPTRTWPLSGRLPCGARRTG